MERYFLFTDWRNITKTFMIYKVIHEFKATPIKIPKLFFTKVGKNMKIHIAS
jgi:hypothetical protein